MRDRLLVKAKGIILILFIFSIKNHSYLGIRVKKNGNEWVIKKVQPGGTENTMNLKNGDRIITIDNQKTEDNSTLEKWLIVESVSEMEIVRNGKKSSYYFF